MTNQLLMAVLPPIADEERAWVDRLKDDAPGLDVAIAEDDAAVRNLVARADAAYGWVPPEALPAAKNLRWLQSPFAAPFTGYYYPELIEHPVVVTNARGIYSDHIAHHILMFMLALSRGLPYWMEAHRGPPLGPGRPQARLRQRRGVHGARQRGRRDRGGDRAALRCAGGEGHRHRPASGARVSGGDPSSIRSR